MASFGSFAPAKKSFEVAAAAEAAAAAAQGGAAGGALGADGELPQQQASVEMRESACTEQYVQALKMLSNNGGGPGGGGGGQPEAARASLADLLLDSLLLDPSEGGERQLTPRNLKVRLLALKCCLP